MATHDPISESADKANYSLSAQLKRALSKNKTLAARNKEMELNQSIEQQFADSYDGILFLDESLRITNFNPAIALAYNLRPDDIGRSIELIDYNLGESTEILDQVRDVLSYGRVKDGEITELGEISYRYRINPQSSRNEGIMGVIMTFTRTLDNSSIPGNAIEQGAPMSWWEWDLIEDRLKVFAQGNCILGYHYSNLEDNSDFWFKRVHPEELEAIKTSLDACIKGTSASWRCEHRYVNAMGDYEWVFEIAQVTRRSSEGRALKMMGTTINIHAHKLMELQHTKAKEARGLT